ncbi:DnaJ protein-like [Hondaea fermentalgiana]|uniref:DnaJ protein-like n=1 Tax=Hondaea fermentalgiana TaxID=2315210 RepID=A0A2R5GHF9_9STRA|nr:DnaJ protein-like [Hondaea fermentalgiana]|eukprot:GBG30025.1 DnaJ protein-like [Hondaea fermentalgiana]
MDEKDLLAQVTAARSLVREQAAVRRRAREDGERELAQLVHALRERASRELELERAVERLRAEQDLLTELADEQAKRCASAQRAEKEIRASVDDLRQTAAKAVQQTKAARAEAREWRAKEADAVAEINRRAVQQAQLRETIQHLQDQAAQHRVTSAEALALQDKLDATRKTLAEALRERDEDRMDHEHETRQLRNALSRAQKAAEDAEAKVSQLEANAPAASRPASRSIHASSVDSREVGEVLQQKVEEQMLEIIRLQTEVTLREKRILEVKQEAQEDIARAKLAAMSLRGNSTRTLSDAATTGDEAEKDDGVEDASDQKSSSANAEEVNEEDTKDNEAASAAEDSARLEEISRLESRVHSLEASLQRARAEASKLRKDLASRSEHELHSQKEIVALNERLLHRERELQDAMREREAQDALELQEAREMANELQADMDTRLLEVARLQAALSKAQNEELRARSVARDAEQKYDDLVAEKASAAATSVDRAAAASDTNGGGTVSPAVMEEMRMLAKLCQSLSSEAATLRAQFQSSGDELAQECRELRDQSLAQAADAKRLRNQLSQLQHLYAESRQENEALQASLRDEALEIRNEALRISGATRQVLQETANFQRSKQANGPARAMGSMSNGAGVGKPSLSTLSARRKKQVRADEPQQDDQADSEGSDHKAWDDESEDGDLGINEAAPGFRARGESAADRLSQIEAENARNAELPTPKSPLEEGEEYAHGDGDNDIDVGNQGDFDGEDFDEEGDADDAASAFGVSKPSPKTRVILNGYLQKAPRSTGNKPYWARWARRWFTLTSTALLYFRSSSSKAPRAVLDLRYIQVYGPKNELDERGCKFYLRTPDRIYQLCAESQSVLRAWLDALEDAIADLAAQGRSRTTSQVSVPGKSKNLYKVLGVSKKSSIEDITSAYESKAAKFHPDVNPDPDMEAFNLLEKAFSVLSTPSLRADYNVSLDIRRLFEGGFVALLHPEPPTGRQSGSFRMRKPLYRRFLTDLGFQSIMWGPPAGNPENFAADDAGCGALPWTEIDSVRNGEEAVEGVMLRLPSSRSAQCFSLVSSSLRPSGEPPLVVHIEVDSPVERDKIVHGLRILVQESRDAPPELPSP